MGAAKKIRTGFRYVYNRDTLIFSGEITDIKDRFEKRTESGKEAKIHGTKENSCDNS